MNLREEVLLDLFTRMAEYIDHHGMDRNDALFHAANDLRNALHRTVAQAAADAMRAAEVTAH